MSDIALNAMKEDDMSGQRQFRFYPKRALPAECNIDRHDWRHRHNRPAPANGHRSTCRYCSTRMCLLLSSRRRLRRPASTSAANRSFACRAADILEEMIDPEPLWSKSFIPVRRSKLKTPRLRRFRSSALWRAGSGLAKRATSLLDGQDAMARGLVSG
ncbi:hypothetical protein [Mesorhizobium sp. SEMIA 3007]|uniref:hypothetical protein n=1 Tax=Mesorhizobium sp. SEMIA 3007 TaxID=1862350 RepID=UPI00114CEDDF|nr:hypothetical protein [Mesorhizobium sp. SEMIA 3007]